MNIKYLQLLQQKGFSIIPVGENKVPIGQWKKFQIEPRTFDEVGKLNSPLYGILTGVDYLEVLDVDLKVFSTAREQKEWWDEFLSFLEDNILDFREKFVIKKTKNNGFHILYKSKRVEGNQKVASLKGHTEAILETRGIGGMVVVYEKSLFDSDYQNIDFISDEDRDILFYISRTYNYIEPKEIEVPLKSKREYQTKEGDVTPWDDFNSRNNVWDIVSDEFDLVKNLNSKLIIRRKGAKSTHSGYIFKDDDLMYLHSTGSNYKHEVQYSAWSAYVRKHHNDDFSSAAKKAYADGYGSRIVRKTIDLKDEIEVDKDSLVFPIDIFPEDIQGFIITANETLNNSIEYMACSLLWALSVSIGNSINIEIIPGWKENSTLWMALVGQPGWGKTPSINRIISPLQKLNSREVKRYYKELDKFEYYDKLSKKDKEDYPEVHKPVKKQFIANDITLEALVDLHQESANSVGVFKDELAGWFKDMNKYREGSDLEFWLSCWSGSPVILTRVTRRGSFISRPSIPILGGIQPGVLTNFNTSENQENGFMDRILLCYPDLKSEYLSRKRIDHSVITWFNDVIVKFYQTINEKVVSYDEDGEIKPLTAVMTEEAYEVYHAEHKRITDSENDDETNQYLKSMLPKQKAYIARFALIIHVFNDFFGDGGDTLKVSVDSVEKAIRLSKYFIENAKKVKSDTTKVNDIKTIISLNKNKSNQDKFKAIYQANPDVCKKESANQLGVSIQMVYRYIKAIEKK